MLKGSKLHQASVATRFAGAGNRVYGFLNQSWQIAKNLKLPAGNANRPSNATTGTTAGQDVSSDTAYETNQEESQPAHNERAGKEDVRRLIQLLQANSVTLEEISAILAWENSFKKGFSQLGKLLLACNVVSEESLANATQKSRQESRSLGCTLVNNGDIQPHLLMAALNLLIMIRQDRISRISAIQALRRMHEGAGWRQAFNELGLADVIADERPRIGELLTRAGLLKAEEAVEAIESSLEYQRKLGETLVESFEIDDFVLQMALQLQKKLESGAIPLTKAGELLALVNELHAPLEDIIAELEHLNRVAQFICTCGIVDEKILYQQDEQKNPNEGIGMRLLKSKLVSARVFEDAHYCINLCKSNTISEEQAIKVLKYAIEHNMSAPKAAGALELSIVDPYKSSDSRADQT